MVVLAEVRTVTVRSNVPFQDRRTRTVAIASVDRHARPVALSTVIVT